MAVYHNRQRKRFIKKLIREIETKGFFLACDDNFYKVTALPNPRWVKGSGRYCYEVEGTSLDGEATTHSCDLWHCCGGAYTLDELREYYRLYWPNKLAELKIE
jgi:hypothetical protein